MRFDFPESIHSLSPEQRLRFYELFAHNLTVANRAIWSDDNLTDGEKVDRMKWVNEILHRVTDKIGVIRLNLHEWAEVDTWEMIKECVAQNGSIGEEITFAMERSYQGALADKNCV